MGTPQDQPSGPDLSLGVAMTDIPDPGMLAGHVGQEPVLLARQGESLWAIGATCTHYGGPLAEGDRRRHGALSWHHACFNLRTGEALRAPALIVAVLAGRAPRRQVVVTSSKLRSRSRRRMRRRRPTPASCIVGAGAAGSRPRRCCAGRATRELTMISAEGSPPCRPSEPLEGLPRRQRAGGVDPAPAAGFYAEHRIDIMRGRA